MPIRKTSLALAAIAGAVAFFIAPHPAGLAKGVIRSASMGSIAHNGLAVCKPNQNERKSMVMELIRLFRKQVSNAVLNDMRSAAKVMGVNVPLCVVLSTGLLTNEAALAGKSWTSGPVFWWYLASKDRSALRKMLHVGYMPDADYTTGAEDCPVVWLRTTCFLRDLMAQCLIEQVGHALPGAPGQQPPANPAANAPVNVCYLTDANDKGACSVGWGEDNADKIKLFTGEVCGNNEGGDSTRSAISVLSPQILNGITEIL